MVATEAEVDKESTKVTKAKELLIPIVQEDFIHLSIEREKKLSEKEIDSEELFIFKPDAQKKRARSALMNEEGAIEGEKPAKRQKMTLKIKGSSAVDPDCEVAEDTHVYEEDKDNVWTVHLSLTDVQRGINSFYILQLLKHDKKQLFTFIVNGVVLV